MIEGSLFRIISNSAAVYYGCCPLLEALCCLYLVSVRENLGNKWTYKGSSRFRARHYHCFVVFSYFGKSILFKYNLVVFIRRYFLRFWKTKYQAVIKRAEVFCSFDNIVRQFKNIIHMRHQFCTVLKLLCCCILSHLNEGNFNYHRRSNNGGNDCKYTGYQRVPCFDEADDAVKGAKYCTANHQSSYKCNINSSNSPASSPDVNFRNGPAKHKYPQPIEILCI